MASKGTIQDEFIEDILECKLCLEPLNQPKSLPCQHAFCLKCIDDLIRTNIPERSIPCPLCRDLWEVPTGGASALKTSFLINRLKDIAKKTTQPKTCDTKTFSCRLHPERALELYCQDENTLICYKCYADHHAGHTFIDTKKAAEIFLCEAHEAIQQQLTSISDILKVKEDENAAILTKKETLIKQVNFNRKQAHKAIDKDFDSKINEIFNSEGTQITSRLSNIEKLQIVKASTESLLTYLENTSNPAEVIQLCEDIKNNGLPKAECDQLPPYVPLHYKRCTVLQDRIIFGSLYEVDEKIGTELNIHGGNEKKAGKLPPTGEENVEAGEVHLDSPANCNESESDQNMELEELSGSVWNSFSGHYLGASVSSDVQPQEQNDLCEHPTSGSHTSAPIPQFSFFGSNGDRSNLSLQNMSASDMSQQPDMVGSISDGPNMTWQSMPASDMSQQVPRQNIPRAFLPQPNMSGSNRPRLQMLRPVMFPITTGMMPLNMPLPYMPGANMNLSNYPCTYRPYLLQQNMPALHMSQQTIPEANTSMPGPTTSMPGSSTSMPGSTTSLPGSNTSMPGSTTSTSMPGSSTSMPESTTSIPGSNTSMSGSTTSLPGSTTSIPGSNTSMPGSKTSMPGSKTRMPQANVPWSFNPRFTMAQSNMHGPIISGTNLSDSNLPLTNVPRLPIPPLYVAVPYINQPNINQQQNNDDSVTESVNK